MSLRDRFDFDREEMIHRLGLDRQVTTMETVLPALGIFSAGLLVGVGLGLMLAPKSGRELRSDIGTGVQQIGTRTRHLANEAAERTQHLVNEAAERARSRLTRSEAGEEAPALNNDAEPSAAHHEENAYADA